MAFKNGNKYLIIYLKQNGADFNHINFDNMTPLCFGSYALLRELNLLNGFATLIEKPFRDKFIESKKKHKSIQKLKTDHGIMNMKVSMFLEKNSLKPKKNTIKENLNVDNNIFLSTNLNYRLNRCKSINLQKKVINKRISLKLNDKNSKIKKKTYKDIQFEKLIKDKKKKLELNNCLKFENNFIDSSKGIDKILIKKLPKLYNSILMPSEEDLNKKTEKNKIQNSNSRKTQKMIK